MKLNMDTSKVIRTAPRIHTLSRSLKKLQHVIRILQHNDIKRAKKQGKSDPFTTYEQRIQSRNKISVSNMLGTNGHTFYQQK